MLFKKEYLIEDVYGDNTVLDRIIDNSRWSIHHERVFKFEGKLYITTYSVGATEQQDEQPYEYEPEDIECPEVIAVEKTIIDYVYAR